MTREEVLKIAKPILFNSEMVRAIQDGTKTITRRLIKPQPYKRSSLLTDNLLPETVEAGVENVIAFSDGTVTTAPYKEGDILYVRETWGRMNCNECDNVDCEQENCKRQSFCYRYKSDGSDKSRITEGWYPSIHMPKEAARYFLRVTGVFVKRLQDMTLGDFLSEGIVLRPEAFNDPDNAYYQAKDQYAALWNTTIKKSDLDKYGWEANPWVWVIKFERLVMT